MTNYQGNAEDKIRQQPLYPYTSLYGGSQYGGSQLTMLEIDSEKMIPLEIHQDAKQNLKKPETRTEQIPDNQKFVQMGTFETFERINNGVSFPDSIIIDQTMTLIDKQGSRILTPFQLEQILSNWEVPNSPLCIVKVQQSGYRHLQFFAHSAIERVNFWKGSKIILQRFVFAKHLMKVHYKSENCFKIYHYTNKIMPNYNTYFESIHQEIKLFSKKQKENLILKFRQQSYSNLNLEPLEFPISKGQDQILMQYYLDFGIATRVQQPVINNFCIDFKHHARQKLKYSTEKRQNIVKIIEKAQKITFNIVNALNQEIEKMVCHYIIEGNEVKLLKIVNYQYKMQSLKIINPPRNDVKLMEILGVKQLLSSSVTIEDKDDDQIESIKSEKEQKFQSQGTFFQVEKILSKKSTKILDEAKESLDMKTFQKFEEKVNNLQQSLEQMIQNFSDQICERIKQANLEELKKDILNDIEGKMTEEFKKHKLISKPFQPQKQLFNPLEGRNRSQSICLSGIRNPLKSQGTEKTGSLLCLPGTGGTRSPIPNIIRSPQVRNSKMVKLRLPDNEGLILNRPLQPNLTRRFSVQPLTVSKNLFHKGNSLPILPLQPEKSSSFHKSSFKAYKFGEIFKNEASKKSQLECETPVFLSIASHSSKLRAETTQQRASQFKNQQQFSDDKLSSKSVKSQQKILKSQKKPEDTKSSHEISSNSTKQDLNSFLTKQVIPNNSSQDFQLTVTHDENVDHSRLLKFQGIANSLKNINKFNQQKKAIEDNQDSSSHDLDTTIQEVIRMNSLSVIQKEEMMKKISGSKHSLVSKISKNKDPDSTKTFENLIAGFQQDPLVSRIKEIIEGLEQPPMLSESVLEEMASDLASNKTSEKYDFVEKE